MLNFLHKRNTIIHLKIDDEVGAGEDLIAIGADILAGCAGGAVGVQVPALLAVHLGVGGFHQRIHGVARKDTHRITPFQGPSQW